MDRNGFGGPYGSSGKLTTLQAGDNGRLSKATGPEVGAEPRGPWAALGVPRFPECAEAATLEPEGLRPRERPPGLESSSRRSRAPLLSTFPAAAGREEGTILKEARLASVGARGSTVEAARGGGAGGGAWSRRGPAEHRSAGSRRHGERIQGAGAVPGCSSGASCWGP